MEMIADTGLLASLDLVELNPALDIRNQTAILAVDLIESLFGKSTLVRMYTMVACTVSTSNLYALSFTVM
jgi:arginase